MKHIPKITPEIRKRIKEIKKPYDPRARRAAMLARNEIFLEEFRGPIIDDDPNERGFYRGSTAWENFCRRWQINSAWDGNIDTLENFLYVAVEVIHRDPKKGRYHTEVENIKHDPAGETWGLRVEKEDRFIYIKIDRWTSSGDIGAVWPRIAELQRQIFGKKAGGASERLFGRNLCWYDLHYEFRLSYGDIEDIWLSECSSNYIKMTRSGASVRELIKMAIKRMRIAIENLSNMPNSDNFLAL